MKYSDIKGFFGYGKLYEEIINNIPENEMIIEIGSYYGRSTAYLLELAKKSQKNISIVSIDTFMGSKEHTETNFYNDFKKNIDNLDEKYPLTVLKGESSRLADFFPDNSVYAIMIDASHEYEDVKTDIIKWIPKVKKGGTLCGDDYDWEGVTKAVSECLNNFYVQPRSGGDCTVDIYAGNFWVYKV
jgi:SAM-dependent methyltransferase